MLLIHDCVFLKPLLLHSPFHLLAPYTIIIYNNAECHFHHDINDTAYIILYAIVCNVISYCVMDIILLCKTGTGVYTCKVGFAKNTACALI